jgi:hypothetical protein
LKRLYNNQEIQKIDILRRAVIIKVNNQNFSLSRENNLVFLNDAHKTVFGRQAEDDNTPLANYV